MSGRNSTHNLGSELRHTSSILPNILYITIYKTTIKNGEALCITQQRIKKSWDKILTYSISRVNIIVSCKIKSVAA